MSPPRFSYAPLDQTWRLGASAQVSARRDSLLLRPIDTVFGNMAVEHAAGSSRHLKLDLRSTEEGSLRLFANGLPIFSVKHENELAPMLEGTLVGYAVRTRNDCAVFHAATVAVDGRCILMPGGKGSGKSTLALTLGREGARYFGDELAFVRFDDQKLEAFPKAVTLKQGSFPFAPDAMTHQDRVRGPIRYQSPPSSAGLGEQASVGLILFPRYLPGASELRITELEPHEVALELIQQCFGGLERDSRMMEIVAALSKTPAYAISFSEGTDVFKILREL